MPYFAEVHGTTRLCSPVRVRACGASREALGVRPSADEWLSSTVALNGSRSSACMLYCARMREQCRACEGASACAKAGVRVCECLLEEECASASVRMCCIAVNSRTASATRASSRARARRASKNSVVARRRVWAREIALLSSTKPREPENDGGAPLHLTFGAAWYSRPMQLGKHAFRSRLQVCQR